MKKVLWISRHVLSPEQHAGLETVCGGPFRLEWWRENVEDAAQLREAVAHADVIAAVLPLHLLAEVTAMAGHRPVLISQARRVLVPTDGPEAAVRFTHGGWQRIKRLELELEPAE